MKGEDRRKELVHEFSRVIIRMVGMKTEVFEARVGREISKDFWRMNALNHEVSQIYSLAFEAMAYSSHTTRRLERITNGQHL